MRFNSQVFTAFLSFKNIIKFMSSKDSIDSLTFSKLSLFSVAIFQDLNRG